MVYYPILSVYLIFWAWFPNILKWYEYKAFFHQLYVSANWFWCSQNTSVFAFSHRLPKSHDAMLQLDLRAMNMLFLLRGVNSSPNFPVTNLQSKTAIHLTTQLVFAKCKSEISWVNRSQSPHLLFHLQLGHLARNLTIQVLDLFTNQKKKEIETINYKMRRQRPFEDFFFQKIVCRFFVSQEFVSPSFCPKDEVSQTHRGRGLDATKGRSCQCFRLGAGVVFGGTKPMVFESETLQLPEKFSCVAGLIWEFHFLTRPLSFPTCYCQGRIICGRTLEQWCQHFQRLESIKGEKNFIFQNIHRWNHPWILRLRLESHWTQTSGNGRWKGRMFGPGPC